MGTYDTHHGAPVSPDIREEMDVIDRLKIILKECEPVMNEHFEVNGSFFHEFRQTISDAVKELEESSVTDSTAAK